MSYRIATYYLLLVLLLHLPLSGQNRRDQNQVLPRLGGEAEVQVLNLVSSEPGKSRLDIGYRIPRSFFVFTREIGTSSSPAGFSANGEIIIEILDSTKASSAQKVIKEDLFAEEAPSGHQDTAFVGGGASFDLSPGTYSVVIEINDRNSNRRSHDQPRKITLKDFSTAGPEIADVLFMRPEESAEHMVVPFNAGGDIPFSQNTRCYAQLRTTAAPESLRITCRVLSLSQEDPVPRAVIIDTLTGSLSPANTLVLDNPKNGFRYKRSDSPLPGILGCVFDLKTDTLPAGMYELELNVTAGTRLASVKKRFQVRWDEMPVSLRQLKLAVDAMQYIIKEDEFSKLRSAGAKKQKIYIDGYWKQRDPTPGTAFNETENEYFRRADYALNNFNTLQEPNGIMTERGKAYILYGPPTSIERNLVPSSDPQEIWRYSNLQKKLVFIDEHHNGNYKLIVAEHL